MNLKETFIWTGHEDGSVVSTRTSAFKPIPTYEKILEEFEASYERHESSTNLYKVHSGETIVLIIKDCIMSTSLTEFENWDEIALFLKQNGNSDLFIGFLKSIYDKEGFSDFYASTIIEHLALKINQSITIQTTDLEYGNEEFEITIQEDTDSSEKQNKIGILEIVNPDTGERLEVAENDFEGMNWESAYNKCSGLKDGWRLPTKSELEQIYNVLYNNGKGNFQASRYWCSTEDDEDFAWGFNFSYDHAAIFNKNATNFVRVVRVVL